MESPSPQEYPLLSPERRMLARYVLHYARAEGGSTPDVMRHATIHLSEDTYLLAEVLDPDRMYHNADDQGGSTRLLSLGVYSINGDEIETLAIDPTTGHVAAGAGDDILFAESSDGAPDSAIESFFRRHILPATN